MPSPRGTAVVTTLGAALAERAGSLEPYVVASPAGAGWPLHERASRAGLDRLRRLDPFRLATAPFLDLLQRLADLVHGTAATALPRWALFDCGEVPGAVLGYGRPAGQVPAAVAERLGVEPGYAGLVPLSLVAAIPMFRAGAWHTFGLGSVRPSEPGTEQDALPLLTLATALAALAPATAHGVTRWTIPELGVVARFAPLQLVTAWTPAHSDPATLTWRIEASSERLLAALAGESPAPAASREVDAHDQVALRALQDELESGRRLEIVAGPRVAGGRVLVPLREAGP